VLVATASGSIPCQYPGAFDAHGNMGASFMLSWCVLGYVHILCLVVGHWCVHSNSDQSCTELAAGECMVRIRGKSWLLKGDYRVRVRVQTGY
jgi:hypothetical protein